METSDARPEITAIEQDTRPVRDTAAQYSTPPRGDSGPNTDLGLSAPASNLNRGPCLLLDLVTLSDVDPYSIQTCSI